MTVSEYQKEAHKFADYPFGLFPAKSDKVEGEVYAKADYLYPALGLAEEAGEVAGKFAKAIRDADGEIDIGRKLEILKELGDVCWFVAEIATLMNVSLEDIMDGNISKLKSRRERGVIHGSGDNR